MKPIAALAELLGGINPIGLALMLHNQGVPINQLTGEYDETILAKTGILSISPTTPAPVAVLKNPTPNTYKLPVPPTNSELDTRYQIVTTNGRNITRLTPDAYEKCISKMNFMLREYGITFKKTNKRAEDNTRNLGYFFTDDDSKGIEAVMTVSSSKYCTKPIEYINPNTRMKVTVPSAEACKLSLRVPTPKVNWDWCIAYVTGWDKVILFRKDAFPWKNDDKEGEYTSKTIKKNAEGMFFDDNIQRLVSEIRKL